MVTPCLECKKRETGCHSFCEEYAKWRKSYDKVVEAQRRDYCSPAVGMLSDYSRKTKSQYHRHTKGWK